MISKQSGFWKGMTVILHLPRVRSGKIKLHIFVGFSVLLLPSSFEYCSHDNLTINWFSCKMCTCRKVMHTNAINCLTIFFFFMFPFSSRNFWSQDRLKCVRKSAYNCKSSFVILFTIIKWSMEDSWTNAIPHWLTSISCFRRNGDNEQGNTT